MNPAINGAPENDSHTLSYYLSSIHTTRIAINFRIRLQVVSVFKTTMQIGKVTQASLETRVKGLLRKY